MNSQTFIEREVNRISEGKELTPRARRHVASICVDDKTIYSYGSHYPLLWQITTPNGSKVWVRNSSGYSATTGKHIGWASPYMDVSAEIYRVANQHFGMRNRTNYDDVLQAIEMQLREVTDTMETKKRKNTQVYAALERERDTLTHYKNILTK